MTTELKSTTAVETLSPWVSQAAYDPLLAEVRLFTQAMETNDPYWLEQAANYAYWNHRTALLEAVARNGVSLTRQQYDAQAARYTGFGQSLREILEEGVHVMTEKAAGDKRFQPELRRRQLELAEQQLIEELTIDGSMNDSLLVVISPYPEELSDYTARELGYDPATRAGKIRIHDYQASQQSKETAEIFFENSSLELTQQIAKTLGQADRTANLVSPSEALGRVLYLPREEYGSYLGVVSQLSPVIYDNALTGESLVAKSKAVVEYAQPLFSDLVNLDREMALSLLTADGRPTPVIDQVLRSHWQKLNKGQIRLPSKEIQALVEGRYRFTEETVRVLQKIALINTYVQVGDLTGDISLPLIDGKQDLEPKLSLFENEQAIAFAMNMTTGMSYCGVELANPYGAYGWSTDMALGIIFGYNSLEKRVTRCPSCRTEWIVSGTRHGERGIRCGCGSSVPGGKGALCIVEAARKATDWDLSQLLEADTAETFD